MPNQYICLNDTLYDYLLSVSLREHPVQQKIREDLATLSDSHMASLPDVAQFLQFLVKLSKAKHVLELGTFVGYSALAMALALPKGGRLVTCDVKSDWTERAKTYWQQAGVSDKIELCLQPALTTLPQLQQQQRRFDFIFIDADKGNLLAYYEQCLSLLANDGLMVIDNTLWKGAVVDRHNQQRKTQVIRQLNQYIQEDSRIDISLLAIGDGLSLIQWRT